MDTPQFADGQFVNAALLNTALGSIESDFAFIGDELHTPGLLSPSTLVFTPTNLVVQIQAPSPFAVLFGNGNLVGAHGTVAGADTTTYSLNFASFVPGSGSQTVYCLAQYTSIGENLVTVVGPPPGHPDYDPTFSPFDFYNTTRDSLTIFASTSAPDNITTFELFRVSLSAGQGTITPGQINTANWHYASSVLNPTGVTAATYTGATITVAADGRITSASSVAYGPLAGNNTWTGNNTFNDSINVTDPSSGGGVLVHGTASGAGIALLGNGATTPNKYIRAINGTLDIVNSAFSQEILQLTDSGTLTLPGAGGNLVVGGNATVDGSTFFGTSGAFYANPNSGGSQLLNFAVSQYLQFIPGTGFVLNTTGLIDLNAPGGVHTSASLGVGTSLVTGTTISAGGSINTNGSISSAGDGTFSGTVVGLLGDGNRGIDTAQGAYWSYDLNGSTPAVGGWFSPVQVTGNNFKSLSGNTYENMYAANFVVSSDAVNKSDIRDVSHEDALSFISSITAKKFVRNGQTEAGFVAQDIKEDDRFEHMVRRMGKNDDEMSRQLGLSLADPIAYHHTAIKHLMDRVETLEKLLAERKSST